MDDIFYFVKFFIMAISKTEKYVICYSNEMNCLCGQIYADMRVNLWFLSNI